MAPKKSTKPKSGEARPKKPAHLKKKPGRPPKPPGRVTELDGAVTDAVCAALRRSCRLETAAELNGVTYQTLRNWIRRGKEAERVDSTDPKELLYLTFVQRVNEALSQAEDTNLGRIDKAAQEGDWKAAAWILKNGPRRKKYAQVDEHKITTRGQVDHTHTHRGGVITMGAQEFAQMPLEVKKALLEVIERNEREAQPAPPPPRPLLPAPTAAPAEAPDANVDVEIETEDDPPVG